MTMRPRRTHSREFKLMVVRQVANGEKRPAQICREHDLGESLLLRWRREYEARGEAAFLPREATGREVLEQRVAELERFCGQLSLENAVLKKALSSSRSLNGTS
jgi:transposase-like protein